MRGVWHARGRAINTIGIAAALGIGLLIGIERERHKTAERAPGTPGLRTFALAGVIGALAEDLGGGLLLAASLVGIASIAVVAAARPRRTEPHATTAAALILTSLLGAMAVHQPAAAAGVAVLVTGLLLARERLHRFVDQLLTADELHDGLILLASVLVILPLTPNHGIAGFPSLNPRLLWIVAVLMMAINATGHLALRLAGARYGLPLAGFFAGFVSSTATTVAMGSRAAAEPPLTAGAVAGATLASVASTAQVGIIVGTLAPQLLPRLLPVLAAAAAVGALYAGILVWRSARAPAAPHRAAGRPFDPKSAVAFALLLGAVMVVSVLLNRRFGDVGALVSTAAAGLADVHTAAAAACALFNGRSIGAGMTVNAIWLAYSVNWAVKAAIAFGEQHSFGWRTLPGLLLMLLVGWLMIAAGAA
ncbi:MAG: MgtC/SapB family protein [Gammaproteobacteria bacterium]|nr:MgtC/SapB family protein [Gammaproteobacteria bacterium]